MSSATVGRRRGPAVVRTPEARAFVDTEARKIAVLALPSAWVAAQLGASEESVSAKTRGLSPPDRARTIERRELLMGGLLEIVRERTSQVAEIPPAVSAGYRVEYRNLANVPDTRYFLVLRLAVVDPRINGAQRVHSVIKYRQAAARIARSYLMRAREALPVIRAFPFEFACYVIDPGPPKKKGSSRGSRSVQSASAPPETGRILARLRRVTKPTQADGARKPHHVQLTTPRGTRLPIPTFTPPDELPARIDADRAARRRARQLTRAATAAASLDLAGVFGTHASKPAQNFVSGDSGPPDDAAVPDTATEFDETLVPLVDGEVSDGSSPGCAREGEEHDPDHEHETGEIFMRQLAEAMEYERTNAE